MGSGPFQKAQISRKSAPLKLSISGSALESSLTEGLVYPLDLLFLDADASAARGGETCLPSYSSLKLSSLSSLQCSPWFGFR